LRGYAAINIMTRFTIILKHLHLRVIVLQLSVRQAARNETTMVTCGGITWYIIRMATVRVASRLKMVRCKSKRMGECVTRPLCMIHQPYTTRNLCILPCIQDPWSVNNSDFLNSVAPHQRARTITANHDSRRVVLSLSTVL
jgi:hypothetical protein